ncbi:MAG: hypothetical protein J6T10_02345 [Methanobrevibacter sp.]|nr:hypothetical protein [Methanobrevibacter sp.]
MDKIVDDAIAIQIDELDRLNIFSPADKAIAKQKMKNIYTNMFIPYTYLRDIPN